MAQRPPPPMTTTPTTVRLSVRAKAPRAEHRGADADAPPDAGGRLLSRGAADRPPSAWIDQVEEECAAGSVLSLSLPRIAHTENPLPATASDHIASTVSPRSEFLPLSTLSLLHNDLFPLLDTHYPFLVHSSLVSDETLVPRSLTPRNLADRLGSSSRCPATSLDP